MKGVTGFWKTQRSGGPHSSPVHVDTGVSQVASGRREGDSGLRDRNR